MAGDGSEGQTVTRRKRVTGSKEVKNVSRKEKKTREVEGASEDSLKEKVTEETSADIQKELTEKLTGLLERDRLGVSLGLNYNVFPNMYCVHCPGIRTGLYTSRVEVERGREREVT